MSAATRRTRLARLAVAAGIGVAIASGQAVAHAEGDPSDPGPSADSTATHTSDTDTQRSIPSGTHPRLTSIFTRPRHLGITGATTPTATVNGAKATDPTDEPKTLAVDTPTTNDSGTATRHERRALSIAHRVADPRVRDTTIAKDVPDDNARSTKLIAPQSVTAPMTASRAVTSTPAIHTEAALTPTTATTVVGPTVQLKPFAAVTRVLQAIGLAFNGGPSVPPSPTPLWAVLTAVHQEIRRFLHNGAPSVAGQQTSTYVENDGTVRGTFTASDPDGDDVAVLASTPAHGTVDLDYDTQTWTYTPESGYIGADTFTLTARDGGLHLPLSGHQTQATVAVTVAKNVAPIPDPTHPFTIDQSSPTDPPGTVRGHVTVHDTDQLIYTATTSAKGGTIAVDANGSFVYTPSKWARIGAADSNAATTGANVDTFTITASDGRLTADVPVTVTVPAAPITTSTISVDVGEQPYTRFIAVSADGTHVIVGNYGSPAFLIDASGATPTTTVADASFLPLVAMSSDGTRAYAIGGGYHTSQRLVIIDPSAPDQLLGSIQIDGTNLSSGAAATSADGTYFYVTDIAGQFVRIVDTSLSTTDPKITTAPVGRYPNGITVSADGTRAYVLDSSGGLVTIVDISESFDHPEVATVTVGGNPRSIAGGLDGNLAYVANYSANTVTIIDTSASVADPTVHTVVVAGGPYDIAVSADGTRAVVANLGVAFDSAPDSVSIIDFHGGDPTVTTVTVGNRPTSVTLSADGTRAYVVYGNSTATILDLSGPAPVVTNVVLPSSADQVVASADGTRAYFINSGSTSDGIVVALDTGGV